MIGMPSPAPTAPFTHSTESVQRIMSLVLLALLPATLFNLYLFGWPAILLFAVTLAACLAAEALCLWLARRPLAPALGDGSALVTGWLLAMSLPPWAPWWTGVLGAIFAIVLAKQAFGGIGQNVFNPAMVARIALLVSFPVVMTAWVAPQPLFAAHSPGLMASLGITFGAGVPDAVAGATSLGFLKTELTRGIPVSQSLAQVPDLLDLSLGLEAGSLGETSLVLILAGGLFLLKRGIISWPIPVAMLGSLFAIASLCNLLEPDRYASGFFHLASGAAILGAFFIATDYVTSPATKAGQLIFGAGCGLLTWVIRTFAGYPEGVAFAVLLMNALSPVIDQYTRPRRFGRTRGGEPLPVKRSA